MTQASYNSQFNGRFTPANDNGTVLKTKAVAPQGSIAIEGRGRKAVPETLEGAEVASTIIYTGKDTFQQYAVITFANGKDTLHVSTQRPGTIVEDADKQLRLGSATLRVDYGHGRFFGASGTITSNFVINDNGEVTDSQVGIVLVK